MQLLSIFRREVSRHPQNLRDCWSEDWKACVPIEVGPTVADMSIGVSLKIQGRLSRAVALRSKWAAGKARRKSISESIRD
jgi:hypothetical protein